MSRKNNKMRATVKTPQPKSTSTTPTKQGRRKMRIKPPSLTVTKLPPIYRATPDTFSIRLKTAHSVTNTTAGNASLIIALTPSTIAAASYYGLADYFPLLTGFQSQYTRFMVSRLSVRLVPVTPLTGGGYVAAGYQPDDSNTSGPPTSLTDVTSALHSDIAQVTEIAAFTVMPCDYFNEWRQCTLTTGTTTFDSQAGVIQLFCANTAAITNVAALLELEVDIHFSGYRKIG